MALLRRLVLATGTLTVVRLPVRGDASPEDLRESTALYPLVGLAVGSLPALVLLLPLPPLPRAVLALAGWVLASGAMHLDGWADCCDAAFAPARADAEETRARRLAILKDPHMGTFGVVGLVLLLLAKLAALVHLSWAAPLLAAPLGRWAMVYVLRAHPPARRDGLGAAFAGRVPLETATALVGATALLVIVASGDPLRGGLAVAAALAAAVAVARFLAGRFGGITGDLCGAAGEAVELVVLWAMLPLLFF